MKALVLTEYKRLEVTDFPTPEVGPRDVLIAVHACGICGSDIHGFDGSSGRRIPPLVMGHEAAGVVAQTGSQVRRFKAGDHVTFDSMISCGECHFCRRGQANLCENRRVLGVSCGEYRRHGAFAQYVAVPENVVYRLPESVPLARAAMVEPISVAVHAVNGTPVRLADTAVVVGSGMIGLLVIQTLRLAGCGRILAIDLDPAKLELARRLGADVTINPQKDDVLEAVKAHTEGRGADISMEVVGKTPTVQTAIAAVRKGGFVTLVGNLAAAIDFPLQSVVTREIRLFGSCASSGEYPACIELLERGAIQVDPLITARATLDEGAAWFDRLYCGEPGAMKVILEPWSHADA
jgi:L-iditol 2-dehydrogenase